MRPGSPETGPPEPARLLTMADLDAVLALHRRSVQGLGPEVVKPETPTFFRELLEGRGSILGVRQGDSLVAYAVLQRDLLPIDDPSALLGLPSGTPVVKLAGAGVDPAWRGQGLQRMLIEERLKRMPSPGVAVSTAAPANPASWRNLLSCGFAVRALQYRYGGHPRFLMAWVDPRLEGAIDPTTAAVTSVPVSDLATQARLLGEGWRGVAAGDDATSIRYLAAVDGPAR